MTDGYWKIEKGVPLPPLDKGRHGPRRAYRPRMPWADMAPGDSILVSYRPGVDMADEVAMLHTRARQWSAINFGGKRKFACRREDTGVRIWRIDGTEWDNQEDES